MNTSRLALLAYLFLNSVYMIAQPLPQSGSKITGTVVDSASKSPVQYATVTLLNIDNKVIDGTMADEKGKFTLMGVPTGMYRLQVTFIGFQTTVTQEIKVDSKSSFEVPPISLKEITTDLNGVEVTGDRMLFETKADKLIYNADKDIAKTGATASDVLQRVPSVSLDMEGNLMLRGSTSIRVLINNKPSSLFAGSIAEALKQLPADMIVAVEVITNPSAKFDAEGTGGIINIITKKNVTGTNGSASLSAGNLASSVSSSVSVQKNKFTTALSINGNVGSGESQLVATTRVPSQEFTNIQKGLSNYSFNGLNMNAALDYKVNDKLFVSAGVRVNNGSSRSGNTQTVLNQAAQTEEFINHLGSRSWRRNQDYNVDITRYFKNPNQELTFLALYTNSSPSTMVSQNYSSAGDSYFALNNFNLGGNKETTFQTDYKQPVGKLLIEGGAKSIFRNVESISNYLTRESGVESPAEDYFHYKQNVVAAYVSATSSWKSFQYQLGLRYEATDISASFLSQQSNFDDGYQNLLPNLSLTYSMKNKQTIRGSFSQRIQRPSLFYMNPYRRQENTNTALQGNPSLKPELASIYEVNYSGGAGPLSLNIAAYARVTDDSMDPFMGMSENKTITISFQNIQKKTSVGMNVNSSVSLFKKWNISGSFNVYQLTMESQYKNLSALAYNLGLNSSLALSKTLTIQGNFNRNSRMPMLFGFYRAFSSHSLSIRKTVLKQKATVTITGDNPFRRYMKMQGNEIVDQSPLSDLAYTKIVDIKNFNRALRISFTYNFGSTGTAKTRQKKSIRNDDMKPGE